MRTITFTFLLAAAVVVGLLGWSSPATAYPDLRYWHMPAAGVAGTNRAGAGGLYGTGGRTDYGIRCSHCHTGAEGLIDFTLDVTPNFGSAGGDDVYTPGQRYTITVTMTGEHRRTERDNANGMALAIEDASGAVAGRYITDSGLDSASCQRATPDEAGLPRGSTTAVYGDCHAVLPVTTYNATSWTFDWVAPPRGAGDLTMFVAVVDGDTLGDSSLHDDVVERAVPLREMP